MVFSCQMSGGDCAQRHFVVLVSSEHCDTGVVFGDVGVCGAEADKSDGAHKSGDPKYHVAQFLLLAGPAAP